MDEEFDSFVEDLLAEKLERPLVIVGSSKVDELLQSILNKYFLPKPTKDEDLLEGDRPLATFSSRIKIAYRLGIIEKEFLQALEQLRAIRNRSAHRIEFKINKSPIKEHLSVLSKNLEKRDSFDLTRQRYFAGTIVSEYQKLQCLLITLCVILHAIYKTIETTSGVQKCLLISNK